MVKSSQFVEIFIKNYTCATASLLAILGIVIGVVAITSMGMLGVNMTMSATASLSENANEILEIPDTGGGKGVRGSV